MATTFKYSLPSRGYQDKLHSLLWRVPPFGGCPPYWEDLSCNGQHDIREKMDKLFFKDERKVHLTHGERQVDIGSAIFEGDGKVEHGRS